MKRALAVWLLALASAARAGEFDLPDEAGSALPFKLSGLLDLRYARTSQQRSWLTGGPGKLRYGGRDTDGNGTGDHDANVFAVPQASLVLDAPAGPGADVHVHANLDADTDSGNGQVNIVEAFGKLERSLGRNGFRLRAGALIPPISREHIDPAWSTRYSITPSAIGSWIGEDVRVFGAEGTWQYAGQDWSARATGAIFGGGDQIGLLLLKRGWSLNDYQAGLNQSYDLFGGFHDEPFKERDGRAGYYGRAGVTFGGDLLDVSGGFFDNQGNPNAVSTATTPSPAQTWRTYFFDGGFTLHAGRLTAIAQYMHGYSQSFSTPQSPWQAYYGLLSCDWRKWTVTGRYDRFDVNHRRLEAGWAWTEALQYSLDVRQRLSVEYVHVRSSLSLPIRPRGQDDQILQLNYRLRWG